MFKSTLCTFTQTCNIVRLLNVNTKTENKRGDVKTTESRT
jgi:hypothetical protein